MRVTTLFAAASVAAVAAFGQQAYVGADACAPCHEDHVRWVRGSVHENVALPSGKGQAARGCEACHGPGARHVENASPETIISFRKETAGVRSGQCLACHNTTSAGLNFRRGDHHTAKVACDDCHGASQAFHRMRGVRDVMARAEPALCFGCHPEQRADFAMPSRHPVREGFMQCSSCHDQHGGFSLRQLRTRGTEAVCGKCHEDKQGPFIFEHPAGRAGDCSACHRPHGSTNPKLLTRAQIRFQCLECHTNTTVRHDLAQPRYQHCTVCHSRIHGSNLNRLLLE